MFFSIDSSNPAATGNLNSHGPFSEYIKRKKGGEVSVNNDHETYVPRRKSYSKLKNTCSETEKFDVIMAINDSMKMMKKCTFEQKSAIFVLI